MGHLDTRTEIKVFNCLLKAHTFPPAPTGIFRALCTGALLAGFSLNPAAAEDWEAGLLNIQTRWAEIKYQMPEDAHEDAYAQLVETIVNLSSKHPEEAGIWAWKGIIKASQARANGGLGALSLAEEAKADCERSAEIDASALQASAYACLGLLYAKVPGWPFGFGDKELAEEYMLKALEHAPDSVDANYFYGDFLRERERYKEAHGYFLKAQQAPPRPGRSLEDQGRQEEIAAALEKIRYRVQ